MRCTTILAVVLAVLLTGCAADAPVRFDVGAAQQKPATAAAQPGLMSPAAVAAPAPRPKATGTPEDARRHMVRGMAAVEMAKSPAELVVAEDEFRMATEIAPQMSAAWFNLALVQMRLNRYGDAIASYRQYLALEPNAPDAAKVQDELIKLEFRQEQQAKTMGRVGLWISHDGAPYHLSLENGRITLRTDRRRVVEKEVSATYPFVGNIFLRTYATESYVLNVQGNALTGSWERKPLKAEICPIPADGGQVTGEINDADGQLVLHHTRTPYRAAIRMQLLSNDVCGEVVPGEPFPVDIQLYGPLPKGGVGVVLYGLEEWWAGGFSAIQAGWQGHVAARVSVDSPAYAAGMRDGDEILAIDDVAVQSLSAAGVVMRLRGEPGTAVRLTLQREDVKEPITITTHRIEVLPLVYGENKPWIN
ncbi:PDZ domain-containing protein [Sulfurivermis fontis]|uniref:PDZ domain-containing protein n=1 Tax=Sulfurivermis fontis TaxID=1972068 RepID=UPI0015594D05|nr:PDZ domain-containing protein [Sulfurivermis fontis]